jgi:hypothetical protein
VCACPWLRLCGGRPAALLTPPLCGRSLPRAGFGVALRMGATYQAFCDTIGIHPTSAEEFTILTITRSSGESTEKGGC